MARNQHHRVRDHMGSDLDSNIVLSDAVGPWPVSSNLHTLLVQQWAATSSDNITVDLRDSGVTTLTTGVKAFIGVPWDGTLTAATLLTDQLGSIVVDIWRTDYTNFPPTAANSICHGVYPTVTLGRKWQSLAPAGLSWDTSIAAGSILAFNVNSVTNVARATLALVVYRA